MQAASIDDSFNSLNSSGDLTFTMPPDFESPGDQGSDGDQGPDNVYDVTVVATEDERPWLVSPRFKSLSLSPT